jgi:phage terminase small subunit
MRSQHRMATRPLPARQQRFVEEYLLDLNATQAAIRAGYSAKTADVTGPRLLGKVGVQEKLQAAKVKRAERVGITQDRVLEEVALLSFSDITHYAVSDSGHVEPTEAAPPGAMRALSSIKRKITTRGSGENAEVTREVEIRLWDKPGPLKLAGRHVGLFPDRLEVTGKNGKPVEVDFRVQMYVPENGRKRLPK